MAEQFTTRELGIILDALAGRPCGLAEKARRMRTDQQRAEAADDVADLCDFFGCANPAMPGSEDCETHQHAVSCESSNGTQITLTCACGETFGPVGEPGDRHLQNRGDALALHAKHAATA